MNKYISSSAIRELREKNNMTQLQLAQKLCVSDKTISKWETAKGLPDITLLEPLAKALGISVMELITGEYVTNSNKSGNMLRSALYICPICGNVIISCGQAAVSCCGVTLPVLEAEKCDNEHEIICENIESELFVTVPNHSRASEKKSVKNRSTVVK